MVHSNIRTHVDLGTEFHLLGLTAVILVLGWLLAIMAASVAQPGLVLSADVHWNSSSVEFVANGAVAVVVTEIIHRLARRRLPAHFFVYTLCRRISWWCSGDGDEPPHVSRVCNGQ